MQALSWSNWLEQATQPQYPYYHQVQISLITSLSGLSTACFTSIPPFKAMFLTALAYQIHHLLTPYFCSLFGYQQSRTRLVYQAFVPLIGQITLWSISILIAKSITHIARQALSFHEIRQVSAFFLITLYIFRFALFKIRQQIHQIE